MKINIPDILVHLRGEDVDSKRGKKKLPSQMDLGMKAASWALSSGKNLGLVEKVLPLGRLAAGPDRKITKLPGIAGGWTQSRDICLVRAGDITAILPEALRRLDATRPQTWISGPSATSDIELERVEGVHGPRTLDVVIVRG